MSETTAMLESAARVPTAAPRRYMAQLCKHFAHKVPATFDDTRGHIQFDVGPCDLEADQDAGILVMRVRAADEAGIERLENVVARHLARFAFREQLDVSWKRSR